MNEVIEIGAHKNAAGASQIAGSRLGWGDMFVFDMSFLKVQPK